MKQIYLLGLVALVLVSAVSALDWANFDTLVEAVDNPLYYVDYIRTNNFTGQNMTFGETDVYGNFTVFNTTGNRVLVVDTTNGKTYFWDKDEGANDYVQVWHDGSDGRVESASGTSLPDLWS